MSDRCAPLSISRQGRETLIRAAVRQEKTASLKAVKSIEKEMVEWGSQCRPMQWSTDSSKERTLLYFREAKPPNVK